jgi:hypothetical protein
VENNIKHVALDTHKKQHRGAMNYPGDPQILEFTVPNSTAHIKKKVKKITKQAPGKVRFCYEEVV